MGITMYHVELLELLTLLETILQRHYTMIELAAGWVEDSTPEVSHFFSLETAQRLYQLVQREIDNDIDARDYV